MPKASDGVPATQGGGGELAINGATKRRILALVNQAFDIDTRGDIAKNLHKQAVDDPLSFLERVSKLCGDVPAAAGPGMSFNIKELHLAAVRAAAEPTTLDVTPDRGTIGVQPNASDW